MIIKIGRFLQSYLKNKRVMFFGSHRSSFVVFNCLTVATVTDSSFSY